MVRIALRDGVTLYALRYAHIMANVNVIKAGDVLVIPCR